MKHGIALIFLATVGDLVLVRNVEFRNPENYLDIKNRSVVEFPGSHTLKEVMNDYLLFKHLSPKTWHVAENTDTINQPVGATAVWNPIIPPISQAPEVTFYDFGEYVSDGVTYELIAVETANVVGGLKDNATILGGPRILEEVLHEEIPAIRDLLVEAWENYLF